MRIRGLAASLVHSALTQQPRGRLGDFRLAGRWGPIVAFIAVAAGLYLWSGSRAQVTLLVQLWVAYCVAFLALAALARWRGADPPWSLVVPAALGGVTVGGLAGAVIALAPNWEAVFDPFRGGPKWAIGAAFAAFFVGLSLATAEIRRREQEAADARRQLLEARLQTLTAQIEPHFLMNTLANLRYLINSDTAAARRMLDHLADFLEGALERSRAPHSTLGQEVQLVESYLSIMQIRMGERLRFAIDVPHDLANVRLPPLLLQTLVENAVTHGIGPKDSGGTIRLVATRDGDRILLRITDDGVGLASPAAAAAHGLGLRNTRERLATFFEGRAELELAPAVPAGTDATIRIPG